MLTYDLSDKKTHSLYAQLYAYIKEDIENGSLPPNTKLPAKRPFAEHLGVSVITVEGAYAQLVSEGYAESRPRSGFYVAAIPEYSKPTEANSFEATKAPSMASQRPERAGINLTGSSMPEGWFPLSLWSKQLRDTLSHEPEAELTGHVGIAGHYRLRQAIANYVLRVRGLNVSPECVIVAAGAQVLYSSIYQTIQASSYAIENPGYHRISRIYENLGGTVCAIDIDEQGIDVKRLRASEATVAHIMPSHQYPTGTVTSAARRHELLNWAYETPNRYIVEDDHDCEFRMAGRPLPTLQSLDTEGRVIYMNTFAKSMGSGFRLAYMILPERLLDAFHEKMGELSCTVPTINQIAFAEFLESGAFERHVNRRRSKQKAVRNLLLAHLGRENAYDHCSVLNEDGGLSFLLEFPQFEEAERFAQFLENEDVKAKRLNDHLLTRTQTEPSSHATFEFDKNAVQNRNKRTFVFDYSGISEEQAGRLGDMLSRWHAVR